MVRLGDLERRVMEILWVEFGSELTGREVAEHPPGYAYTTVLTVLTRLEKKGLVRHQAQPNSLSRRSSIPKWWPISWITVLRTSSTTS